jgi:glucose/arabinose dehydrogenase
MRSRSARSISTLLSVVLVAACAPADEAREAEDAAPAAETERASAPSLADFAGTWQNEAMLEGVEEPVETTMSGSASGDDWTMSLEGRPNVPVEVSIVGDSLVGVSEEYESILRPGVMVSVRTANVLQDGMLLGNLVATYRTPEGEERVTGTLRGTRVQ